MIIGISISSCHLSYVSKTEAEITNELILNMSLPEAEKAMKIPHRLMFEIEWNFNQRYRIYSVYYYQEANLMFNKDRDFFLIFNENKSLISWGKIDSLPEFNDTPSEFTEILKKRFNEEKKKVFPYN